VNRFDLALDKPAPPAPQEFTPEKWLLREIYRMDDAVLLEKATLCLELAKSFNNVPYMNADDLEVVASEFMHFKLNQLMNIYRRVYHKEYEKKA
jgi:hypothetical protein